MWIQSREYLTTDFRFDNLARAVVFMEQIALICDKMQHKPSWEKSEHWVKVWILESKSERKHTATDLQKMIDEMYKNI